MVRAIAEMEMCITVRDLVAFKSRTVGQPGDVQATSYLHDRLQRMPGLQVAPLAMPWRNVVATLPGTDPASRSLHIIGAHYHTANDTLAKVSLPYAAKVGQLGLSIIATLANTSVAAP
jgi:hypothetical protein